MGTDKSFVKSRLRNYAQAAFMLGVIYGGYLVYNGSAGRAAEKIEASASNVWNNWLNVHVGIFCDDGTCSIESPSSKKPRVVTAVFRGYLLAILIACFARMMHITSDQLEERKGKGYKGTAKDFYVIPDLIRRCDGFRVWMLLFSPIFLTMDLYYKIAISIIGVLNARVSFTSVKKIFQRTPKAQWDKPSTWPPLPKKLHHRNPSFWRLPEPLERWTKKQAASTKKNHPLYHYPAPLLREIFDREGNVPRHIFSHGGFLYCTDGIIVARFPIADLSLIWGVNSHPYPTNSPKLLMLTTLFGEEFEMPNYHLTDIGIKNSGCNVPDEQCQMAIKHGLVWGRRHRNGNLFCVYSSDLTAGAIIAVSPAGDPEPGPGALWKVVDSEAAEGPGVSWPER